MIRILVIALLFLVAGCASEQALIEELKPEELSVNILDYSGDISGPEDRSTLSFSDQGAWFSYGLPSVGDSVVGFKGPFLMQLKNGVWLSPHYLDLIPNLSGETYLCVAATSHVSHLECIFENSNFRISMTLHYSSGRTAITEYEITNISGATMSFAPSFRLSTFEDFPVTVKYGERGMRVLFHGLRSGLMINILNENPVFEMKEDSHLLKLETGTLAPDSSRSFIVATSSVMYGDPFMNELEALARNEFMPIETRVEEKRAAVSQTLALVSDTSTSRNLVIQKCFWTLQNNWRIASGELAHAGLFPSYHYEWFHGFWAWDSWKHAAAVTLFNPELAKDQVRAMYDFMDDSGFIPDCIYRDQSIEPHNYRNTKPPLSAWAIWKIYESDRDTSFLTEMFDRLELQHAWWYANRDFDRDGMCEYGSTDGTLIAAKWESGMDNAVRFDSSALNKINENAYTLNQESVDLNAYLLAEKTYLGKIAKVLGQNESAESYAVEFHAKVSQFQKQFFDAETGWFYDTSLDGSEFIKVKGCEGWTPLWANLATKSQAEAVKNTMVSDAFNRKVPFQTLDANHSKFKPDRGYWRGPVWLDQTYFGIRGLKNYGYESEAHKATEKVLNNCEGLTESGGSIRENYHPITGAGMEAQNFSWSAAHLLLMLTE